MIIDFTINGKVSAGITDRFQVAVAENNLQLQKPAIATDIGIFLWLIIIVQENPVLIIIVNRVIAVLVYFGYYNRRY